MKLENLRFDLRVVDTETDETIISDYCSFTHIDREGGCESVEIHVASALRKVRGDLEKAAEPADEVEGAPV